MFRFTIRDVLWLTLVVGLLLHVAEVEHKHASLRKNIQTLKWVLKEELLVDVEVGERVSIRRSDELPDLPIVTHPSTTADFATTLP
jgi:hypothetical protein